ncbi:MAG: hypothetical protein QOJ20_440 [Mycobacterium sp.]|nr:hypothetical protein [Mycobacterium sp.]
MVCGLAGVGVVGLADGRSPAGEQVESIARGRSGLGAVGGEGQAGVGWEFHGLIVEPEFADDRVVVSLEPGSKEAHVVGGPPLAEGLWRRAKFTNCVRSGSISALSSSMRRSAVSTYWRPAADSSAWASAPRPADSNGRTGGQPWWNLLGVDALLPGAALVHQVAVQPAQGANLHDVAGAPATRSTVRERR